MNSGAQQRLAATVTPHDYIDSARFALALRSGIHRVIKEQDDLNRINVFPVADGDTGTNLSLSLSATLPLLERPRVDRLDALLAATADALLEGARGNSGAIMAQFFQGMSDYAEGLDVFDATSFSGAVNRGSDYARDAVADPKQGTILSVIAAFAQALGSQSLSGAELDHVLHAALEVARKALARTESQLEVLRKAGVVDAGAKGFLLLLEGMHDLLVDGREAGKPAIADILASAVASEAAGTDIALNFRYCTECLVTGEDIDRRKLRESLSELGNSLVIAGTKRKAKLHIHVNDPDAVFRIARRFGSPSGEKADDMQMQQHSSHSSSAKFAVITDSAADISDEDLERLDIHIVPIRIQFGDRGFLDKVSITPEEFFEELRCNPAHPTTSQPSPGDFRRQLQFLASHFADVVSVNLSGAVSGTLQAAQTAAGRVVAGGEIHVVDSLNASVGQGLLGAFVANCAAAGLDASTALAALKHLVARTHSFALVRDLSYAVRGGRVANCVKRASDMLRITPILGTQPDGRFATVGVLPGRRNRLSRFASFVAKRVAGDEAAVVAIGHALCENDAVELKRRLQQEIRLLHSVTVTELGSAFGVHGGPGTLVVGVQPHIDPAALQQS